MSRNGILVTTLGALMVIAMLGGYILLQDDSSRDDRPVRPGVTDRGGSNGRGEIARGDDDGRLDARANGATTVGSQDADADGSSDDDTGEGDGEGEGLEAADGGAHGFDPDEVNEPVPGHMILRILDAEDDRPLVGTTVTFPLKTAQLTLEAGNVKVPPRLARYTKRTNRHGVAIWSDEELRHLADEQEDLEDTAPTSVVVTSMGYADLFEPLAIPDLEKGAEHTFKLQPAARVTGKVREKRTGIVEYAEVQILQTNLQGDSKKPLNRFNVKADALGEFQVKLADNYLYTFHVKQPGYAEYTSRVFNFREDQRQISIILEAARGISGVVLGTGNKPIEGAEVWARDDGEKVKTDKKGHFAFDMVKDRIYRNDVNLRVSAEGYAPKNEKVLANDHNVKVVLDKEGTLRGVVLNDQGQPVEGATVNCTYMERRARYPYDSKKSDAKGAFQFGGFARGRVLLSATYKSLHSQTETIQVRAKQASGPVTLKLTTGAAIRGTVTASGGGVNGATIAVDGKATTATGAGGAFTVTGLKPGKYKVKIINDYPIANEQIRQLPVFTTNGKSYYYLPKEQQVEVKLGAEGVVKFQVEPFNAEVDRRITVRVVTKPSEAVSGLQVTLTPVLGSPPEGIPDPKKSVQSLDLPDGNASLEISLVNGISYEATFEHNRFFTATLNRQTLEGVGDGETVEVVLDRAFMIKGYVRDSGGNGIENVNLSKTRNNPWRMEVTTDVYGYFEFGQLKAGDYLISAFKNSYYQEQVEVEVNQADPEPLEITLVGANEIRIIVTDNGTPQPGAHVHIYRNDAEGDDPDDFKRHFDIGTTDAEGEKYINFHWVRNYQIVAFHGDKVAFVNFNNLKEEPEREFTIALEPSYRLSGIVLDEDTQQPLPRVFVRAHIASTGTDGRDGNFFQMRTDNSGAFDFRVPAGDFYFYVPRTRTHESFNTEGNSLPAGSTDVALEIPLRDDIEGNYAQMLGFSAPLTMTAGEEYTVDVTVKNVGSTTWVSAGNRPWRLGSQSPRDNNRWGMSRVAISDGREVRPGDTYTFSVTVTAPGNAGNHAMQWQMVQDGREWFGQTTERLTINVQPSSSE